MSTCKFKEFEIKRVFLKSPLESIEENWKINNIEMSSLSKLFYFPGYILFLITGYIISFILSPIVILINLLKNLKVVDNDKKTS